MSRILEKQLTDYLVTDQARFYRLAYSYLKDREEAVSYTHLEGYKIWAALKKTDLPFRMRKDEATCRAAPF